MIELFTFWLAGFCTGVAFTGGLAGWFRPRMSPPRGSNGNCVPMPPSTPAPQPRRFVSITRTVYGAVHTLDAVADDGTAWWIVPGEVDWTQLPALPDREVG